MLFEQAGVAAYEQAYPHTELEMLILFLSLMMASRGEKSDETILI